MGLKDRARNLLKNKNLVPIYNVAGGLSEFWALMFGIPGIILAFRGKLDANYALMVGSIQAILVAHDAIDGFLEHKKQQENNGSTNVPPVSS